MKNLLLVFLLIFLFSCEKFEEEKQTIIWENSTSDSIVIAIDNGDIIGLIPYQMRIQGNQDYLGLTYQLPGLTEKFIVKSRNVIK